jgi:hypothetical protein
MNPCDGVAGRFPLALVDAAVLRAVRVERDALVISERVMDFAAGYVDALSAWRAAPNRRS